MECLALLTPLHKGSARVVLGVLLFQCPCEQHKESFQDLTGALHSPTCWSLGAPTEVKDRGDRLLLSAYLIYTSGHWVQA